jgi:hypothetical protein
MTHPVLRALFLVVLPAAVIVGGDRIMAAIVGHGRVTQQLRAASALGNHTPLNARFRGYTPADVHALWGALDPPARTIEQHFLELDLLFPFLYGGALATALLLAWVTLGRPVAPAWILLPVAITVLADWTENLVQLSQLHRYMVSGEMRLQSGWIHVSSAATIVKLICFTASALLVLVLGTWIACRGRTH